MDNTCEMISLALLALVSIPIVLGACPNQCSGHGRCTNYAAQFSSGMAQRTKVPLTFQPSFGYDISVPKKDSCTCFTKLGFDGSEVYAWTGADCSLKTCPYGHSHGGAAAANNDHTSVLECSGAGLCDRQSGRCRCNAGFTGHSCERNVCPNGCSGRGVCKSLKDIAADVASKDASFAYSTANAKYASAFDAEQSRACVCDKNYIGADCSILQCKSDADPMGGRGAEYGRDCSGRGICREGVCKCFKGFFGANCNRQKSNIE